MDEHKDRERQRSGYEQMLQRVAESLDSAGDEARPRLRQALDDARRRAVELGELGRDEAERVAEYLRRDIEEAGRFLANPATDNDLRGWFRIDLALLESWLYDRFSMLADRTRLEWLELHRQWSEAEIYHTGEMTGPGELRCLACERSLHFERPGHIPPCPSCHGTHFERLAG